MVVSTESLDLTNLNKRWDHLAPRSSIFLFFFFSFMLFFTKNFLLFFRIFQNFFGIVLIFCRDHLVFENTNYGNQHNLSTLTRVKVCRSKGYDWATSHVSAGHARIQVRVKGQCVDPSTFKTLSFWTVYK